MFSPENQGDSRGRSETHFSSMHHQQQQQHREALRGEELAKALTATLRTVPDFPKPGLERFSD